MTTTYKGYEITECASDRFIIRLDGKNVTTVQGSLSCAKYAIDTGYDDMTPVDIYEGLELSEDVPTSEEINEALGVKEVCSFTEAVEANVAETKDFTPIKERQLTEEQKHFYWEAYHEGHEEGARHKEDELLQGAVTLK